MMRDFRAFLISFRRKLFLRDAVGHTRLGHVYATPSLQNISTIVDGAGFSQRAADDNIAPN